MSLSLCEVVCMPGLIADRGEKSVALVELVVTAYCLYDLIDVYLVRLSLWTLKPQAQKLWPWHDGMAGFVRPASARVCCFFRCLSHRLVCIPLPSRIQEPRCFPGLLTYHPTAISMNTNQSDDLIAKQLSQAIPVFGQVIFRSR
jgi:hypothetical protein